MGKGSVEYQARDVCSKYVSEEIYVLAGACYLRRGSCCHKDTKEARTGVG